MKRLILKRILPTIIENNMLPDTQFGFYAPHLTIHPFYRVVNAIRIFFKTILYSTCKFSDISQTFNHVWHYSLLYKLKSFLPPAYYPLIKSYLPEHYFQIPHGAALSDIVATSDGVSRRGILFLILQDIFASDRPIPFNTSVTDYAENRVNLCYLWSVVNLFFGRT